MGELPTMVWAGLLACALGVAAACYLALGPRPRAVPIERRRHGAPSTPGTLTKATDATSAMIDRSLQSRPGRRRYAAVLEQAGVHMRLQDLVLLVIAGTLTAGAAGLVLVGPLVGLLCAAAMPLLAKLWLGFRTTRRQKEFANQLEDSLQLMAGSLRAGHSLLQGFAQVASESEQPTSEEFTRVLNEIRLGRPMGQALEEIAVRMKSEDFEWVTQAIAINREVGGNLADVLDRVGDTIRERNQIRRQVKSLSAEGKLSALVLMGLPLGVIAFLMMANPGYLAGLTENVVGWGMIAAGVVEMTVGALWLRKVVRIQF